MGSKREDVDQWLILEDPVNAREYIRTFDWNCPPQFRPGNITLNSGRTIYFETMTDEEACAAAACLLRDVEVPMVMRQKQLEMWEH